MIPTIIKILVTEEDISRENMGVEALKIIHGQNFRDMHTARYHPILNSWPMGM